MGGNPLFGVLFHWLGGLSSASFYVPYKRVKLWSWEIFWLTGGIFSWVLAPWIAAFIGTEDVLGVLSGAPASTLQWCYFFGAMWGFGGLTFGLTMRYLGVSLGMAVALGLTTAFGTLVPPIFEGEFAETLLSSTSGFVVLLGILLTLVGIAVVAMAGHAKEQEVPQEERIKTIAEFDFRKGIMVAIFSGIMSSCFAYGLAAGEPIREASLAAGTGILWQGLPVLCVVLAGGFTTNFIWCTVMIVRNKSAGQWIGRQNAATNVPPAEPGAAAIGADGTPAVQGKPPLLLNYGLCAVAGVLWYLQFFFYTMGESQMGRFGFSSWTLHMASIIIFSTLWGFALGEWRASSAKTKRLVFLGIAILVGSTGVIGYGNFLS
ncbi:L-rhamnose/proton symporter RhaT [Parvularcula flava]|uniref:L-rhamnose-proton symporter n=1 Tax=Aquisalinus luteolus TaxID=1566827 RepID=A0A8J3A4R3_9PROT|nr:L-rhamnose/proton symporter RhaT [Aquisalinus luteolus]NHK26420.1 L-rhamnose/proton symporter RhaT [Aquisalinus luteolus]GGH92283.1 L-rhamnose-proton symporter [Aquisalinus luteolus]